MIKVYNKTVVLLFAAAFVMLIPNNAFSKMDMPPMVQTSEWGSGGGGPGCDTAWCKCENDCQKDLMWCSLRSMTSGPWGTVELALCGLDAFDCDDKCAPLWQAVGTSSKTTPSKSYVPPEDRTPYGPK